MTAFDPRTVAIASHIRGRVVGPVGYARTGRPIWRTEVYNTRTGRVVSSDDAFSLAAAVTEVASEAAVARLAWSYGFTRKALR